MSRFTASLDDPRMTLAEVGGKALNLVRLTRAGFAVPAGFTVRTSAYHSFVEANGLNDVIDRTLASLDPAPPSMTANSRAATNSRAAANPRPIAESHAIEAASTLIRAAFTEGTIPDAVASEIHSAATTLGNVPLAVRSSATAEDLPDLSFAGQQDTLLNVIGTDQLVRAFVDCWSSLWTARAIGYRLRNGVQHEGLGLAVVVQELVVPEASGVLFTADPLTGVRSLTVIDAVPGLGESLVSGQSEPDHWEVGSHGEILAATPGRKQTVTVPEPGGGVTTRPSIPEPDASVTTASTASKTTTNPVLTDVQVAELTRIGRSIEREYGSPQDVEWALSGGNFHILQSRPITSLFPVPDGPDHSLWFSFGAFQGMLRPITPAGRDALIHLGCGAARVFTGRAVDPERQQFVGVAGERLWIRFDQLLRHPLGARVVPFLLRFAEPGTAAIVQHLQEDPRWAPSAARPSPASVLPLLRLGSRILSRLPLTLAAPAARRRRFDRTMQVLIDDAASSQDAASSRPDAVSRLGARVEAAESTLATGLASAFANFAPLMVPAAALLVGLGRLARRVGPEAAHLPMDITRSLPGNPTTAMDLALWDAAVAIRRDAAGLELVVETDAAELAARYTAGALPPGVHDPVDTFLEEYGMRGVAEIDLGATRWSESPQQVFATLKNYLLLDSESAPDLVFEEGLRVAESSLDRLVHLVRERSPLPPATLVRFVASRLRILFGAREVPKFLLVKLLAEIRAGLLASGADLVDAGLLDRPDDVMFLHLAELRTLAAGPQTSDVGDADAAGQAAGGEASGWTGAKNMLEIPRVLVARRRARHEGELRRRQVPRLLAGDGHAWFEGLGEADGGIIGSPVSPGVAEGRVRVVHDPATAHFEPGEILVCAGTDPAWTPLFLSAAGLVTEVGGLMTHGAVVAREYGLPAVVGVHDATNRLPTGTLVRIDGATGRIEVLESDGPESPAGRADTAATPGGAGARSPASMA